MEMKSGGDRVVEGLSRKLTSISRKFSGGP
jgi:hypothetical protein